MTHATGCQSTSIYNRKYEHKVVHKDSVCYLFHFLKESYVMNKDCRCKVGFS